ncbi:MAG: molybdenum cofactor guanylyltransferase [Chloroflexota bacterium]|nr:molybdenum cofactor guanylyltransferase [Chloroflexota bacterium]MDE2840843.1 molybdenum cofactor guanylyltransferase [Chloroflexota bacterium]MDE2930909.1 molybdenum cofactor guanylyltransferase [Chloroflexota bacterium]
MGASVTGLILAGGKSKRLGRDKALLPWPRENSETTLLQHVHTALASVCAEVIVVGNRADITGFTVVSDVSAVGSSLTGLVSGLQAARTRLVIAVACDMPFLNVQLLRALIDLASDEWDAVAPLLRGEPETLHTVYHRRCLTTATQMLQAGDYKLTRLLERLHVRQVSVDEVRLFDPDLASFSNINTPEELALARETLAHS